MTKKNMVVIGGQAFTPNLKTEVFARFLSEPDLLNLLARYAAALKNRKGDLYAPTGADILIWREWVAGTKTHTECAKSMKIGVSSMMWRFGIIGRQMAAQWNDKIAPTSLKR